MDGEPTPIGPEIDRRLVSLSPDTIRAYQELKEELRLQIQDERRHYRHVVRFLRKRKAKPEEYEELRAKREEEIRGIHEEFQAEVRSLVEKAMEGKRAGG